MGVLLLACRWTGPRTLPPLRRDDLQQPPFLGPPACRSAPSRIEERSTHVGPTQPPRRDARAECRIPPHIANIAEISLCCGGAVFAIPREHSRGGPGSASPSKRSHRHVDCSPIAICDHAVGSLCGNSYHAVLVARGGRPRAHRHGRLWTVGQPHGYWQHPEHARWRHVRRRSLRDAEPRVSVQRAGADAGLRARRAHVRQLRHLLRGHTDVLRRGLGRLRRTIHLAQGHVRERQWPPGSGTERVDDVQQQPLRSVVQHVRGQPQRSRRRRGLRAHHLRLRHHIDRHARLDRHLHVASDHAKYFALQGFDGHVVDAEPEYGLLHRRHLTPLSTATWAQRRISGPSTATTSPR